MLEYVVDLNGGADFDTIVEAIEASRESWWRRLLHRVVPMTITVRPGIYGDRILDLYGTRRFRIKGEGLERCAR